MDEASVKNQKYMIEVEYKESDAHDLELPSPFPGLPDKNIQKA